MPDLRATPGPAEQALRTRVEEARRKAGPRAPLPRPSDSDVEFLLTLLDIERGAVAHLQRLDDLHVEWIRRRIARESLKEQRVIVDAVFQ